MKNKTKEKGFSLIEILVTILIISIVFGIGTYFLLNTVNNSKNKSKVISQNNIKSSAILYAREYPNNLTWKNEEYGDNKYTCVSIQDLINAGYYKEKQMQELNTKYVLLTKNSSNTIIKEELREDMNDSCILPPNQYYIVFNGNGATSGEITLTSCIRDEDCQLAENQYKKTGYKFMGWSTKENGGVIYKDKEIVKNITKEEIIPLFAVWAQNKVYIRYHSNGGTIQEMTEEAGVKKLWSTKENGMILKNGKSYLDMKYGENLEKGLADYNSQSNINITKQGHTAVIGKEWCTEKDGTGICYDQTKKLTEIGTGTEPEKLCDATEHDCTIDLYVNWKKNIVILRYDPNYDPNDGKIDGDKFVVTDKGIRKKENPTAELQTIEYGEKTTGGGLLNYNNENSLYITWKGHTAVEDKEWCNDKGKCYSQKNQKIPASTLCPEIDTKPECIVNLHVNWRQTKVYFRFHKNEGTVEKKTISKGITYIWTEDEEGALKYNNTYWKNNDGVKYNSTVNFPNYNSDFLKITKENYEGKDWCTGISANGNCYNPDKDYKNVGIDKNHFCDARYKDCTVDLYVGWKIEKFKVAYNANGGKGKMASQYCNRGENCILTGNTYTKKGYSFIGWKKENSGKLIKDKANEADAGQNGEIVTYYAQWTPNKITVYYRVNGGTITKKTPSNNPKYTWTTNNKGTILQNDNDYTQIFNYGATKDIEGQNIVNYNNPNFIHITKTGYHAYSGKEWCTEKNGTGTCYSQTDDEIEANDLCDASIEDCQVILYVNWQKNKVTVRYHPNGGTVTAKKGDTTWTINQSDGTIRKDGGEVQTINYGQSVNNGLYDYNGSNLEITRNGYHAYKGREWCTKRDGTGTCYNQSSAIQASNLCNASEKNCTITVYVNWQNNPQITFSTISGSYPAGTNVTITCNGGSSGIKSFDAWDNNGNHGNGYPRNITLSSTGNRTITATCTSNSGKTETSSRAYYIYQPAPPPQPSQPQTGGTPTPQNPSTNTTTPVPQPQQEKKICLRWVCKMQGVFGQPGNPCISPSYCIECNKNGITYYASSPADNSTWIATCPITNK